MSKKSKAVKVAKGIGYFTGMVLISIITITER